MTFSRYVRMEHASYIRTTVFVETLCLQDLQSLFAGDREMNSVEMPEREGRMRTRLLQGLPYLLRTCILVARIVIDNCLDVGDAVCQTPGRCHVT